MAPRSENRKLIIVHVRCNYFRTSPTYTPTVCQRYRRTGRQTDGRFTIAIRCQYRALRCYVRRAVIKLLAYLRRIFFCVFVVSVKDHAWCFLKKRNSNVVWVFRVRCGCFECLCLFRILCDCAVYTFLL